MLMKGDFNIMTETQKYLYADSDRQTEHVNRLEWQVFTIFSICNFMIVFVAFLRGYRTAAFTGTTFLISAVTVVAMLIAYLRKRDSSKIRWISLVALVLLTLFTTTAFDSYYMRFAVVAPMAVYILYYDSKFMVSSAVAIMLTEIATTVQKFFKPDCTVDRIDICTATAIVIFYLIVVCFIEGTGKKFRLDMLGSLQDEKDQQEKMMQDVIYVASEVRKGTAGAMDIMNQLNESTSVVTGAVKDISDSTQSTAENIQNQTVMTQSIQDAIEKTLHHSESMVTIAEKAKELNEENLSIVKKIQNQSETIAETNDEVAVTMQTLQERANAVKGIADTIFDISSQTNLLALNASIESARAGEAGKGFAVVADEIRQLAEKTRVETENIASILGQLSENAADAVNVVAKSASAAGQQNELIGRAVETFDEMNTNVGQLTQDIADIDTMLTDLSEANNHIVDSITHLSATSEEVTAASAQAEGLSSKNLTNADQTKSILDQVLHVSKQLDKYVGTEESDVPEIIL